MGEKKSNKTPLIITIIVLVLLLGAGAAFFLLKKPKPVPYVEYQGFAITPATDEYKTQVYAYTTDNDNKEIKNLADFEDAYATHKFYDYKVSEGPDNTNEISFKYDATVPVVLTRKEDFSYIGQWHYTYSINRPVLFDYYTGFEYLLDNFYASDEANDAEYKYTTLVFGDKEYRIGVKQSYEAKWAGTTKIDDRSYSDTCYETVTYTISTPKDFDGLMIGLLKAGANEERSKLTQEKRERYNELKSKQDATLDELQELAKMEEENNTPKTLLESRLIPGYVYLKDDFYVFRVDAITPAE